MRRFLVTLALTALPVATPQAGENEPMIMMSMQMGMHNRLQPVMT